MTRSKNTNQTMFDIFYQDKMDGVSQPKRNNENSKTKIEPKSDSKTQPKSKSQRKPKLPLLSILPIDDLTNDTESSATVQDDLPRELFRERIAEQKQRRRFRVVMFWCFFILLLAQYAGLATLLGFAVWQGFLDKIQPLVSIVVPATLGETYAIVRVMVNFIFSPGDFSDKDKVRQ